MPAMQSWERIRMPHGEPLKALPANDIQVSGSHTGNPMSSESRRRARGSNWRAGVGSDSAQATSILPWQSGIAS
jgi:hypothetical protein